MNIKDEIKSYIKVMINSKMWVKGNKLPTEHELADTFFCSRLTIRNAYKELIEEGYLTVKSGVGYYVDKNFLSISSPNYTKEVSLFNGALDTEDNSLNIFEKIKTRNISISGNYDGYIKKYFYKDVKEPYQLIKAFVNPKIFKKLSKEDLEKSVAYAYWKNNERLTRRKRIIVSRKLTNDEKIEFNLDYDDFFIVTYCILINDQKELIEYSITYNKLGHTEIYCDQELS